MTEESSLGQSFLACCECCGCFICPDQLLRVVFGRYQGIQWLQDLGSMGNETMVEIDKAHKFTQLPCGSRLGKIADDVDLAVQWPNALAADMMA